MKMRFVVAAAAAFLITLVGLSASTFLTESSPKKLVVGDEQPLGEGTVRTWVLVDENDAPLALGVTVSERTLDTLPPADSLPAPFHMYNMQLQLPEEARAAGFDHVLFDWNAVGHEPPHLYMAPHFDVHFYMIDAESRKAINPGDPDFEAKGMKAPAPEYVPADYINPPGNLTVPEMGTHWLDKHAPEVNGQPFTHTMLYGFYDGQMIFIEPMLTIEYLKTKPDLVLEMKQPAKYQRPGYYPTSYRYRYDAKEKEYSISIEGLTPRS